MLDRSIAPGATPQITQIDADPSHSIAGLPRRCDVAMEFVLIYVIRGLQWDGIRHLELGSA